VSEQTDTVRREFTRQAASFEERGSLFGRSSILEWIAEQVPVGPVAARDHVTPVDGWLEQACTPPAEREAIVAELAAEADRAGPATGLRAHRVQGELAITQTWVLLGG
jgi:hypothetical protein